MTARRRIWYAIACLALAAGAFVAWYARDTKPEETAQLAAILKWSPGRVVAEIGAGKGEMTVAAAERVGPSGHVFSTEINSKRLADIQANAEKHGLTNITVIRAGEADANLPPNCCDAIFMRDVYHHFTHPAEIDRSLYRALRPGGLLAVIDFPPAFFLNLIAPVKAAPKSHKGHGIPRAVLIEEFTASGFQVEKVPRDSPARAYCVVFRKPVR